MLVGGDAFKHMLGKIDTDAEIKQLTKDINESTSVSKKDVMIKRLKYLVGLRNSGISAKDAYVIDHVPVIPAVNRPITVGANNKVEYADINQLYRDSMVHNEAFSKVNRSLPPDMLIKERGDLYKGVASVFGVMDPVNAASNAREMKGLLQQVAGKGSPKTGLFHSKILSKKQDFSGRGTIYSEPTIGFNEVAVPHDNLWTMYKFHCIRDMVKNGANYIQAEKSYAARDTIALNSFNKMIKEVPVIVNRNPTLMRSNITAFYPVPIQGRAIGINPIVLPLFAGDYDGDALNLYTPMGPEAVHEAKTKVMAQNQIFDYRKGVGNSLVAPAHEAILGSTYLSTPDTSQKVVTFNTENEALEALRKGVIRENTPIKVLSLIKGGN